MFTKFFKDITKGDASTAGGKGASLGEMTRADISVPDGFVLVASAFEQFLKETDLNVEIDSILHTVKHNEMHTVEHASERIQALILSVKMPKDIVDEVERSFKKLGAKYVAVRSSATAEDSATAAWAGQLDTFLNTTKENLLENVKKCWASLFTPRAIFYRFEKGLHGQRISVAVVVQKMIESEKSGIAFSVHPVTEDRNQLIIEAGFGLGEAIVSGQITPDSYVVEKEPRRIIDINVNTQNKSLIRAPARRSLGAGGNSGIGNEWVDLGKKGEDQVLSEKEILELSEIILNIEKHYGFPVDIEWARESDEFYITQSRPITTLAGKFNALENDAPYLNKEDFVFSFESQGSTFLFEDVVVSYYIDCETLELSNSIILRMFVHKDGIIKLNAAGASLTTEKLKKSAQIVKNIVREMEGKLSLYRKKKILTKKDVLYMFKKLASIFREYKYFDIHYSDGIWISIKDNLEAKNNVKFIEQYKNEIREKLNMPFLEPKGWLMTISEKLSKQFDIPNEILNWYREDEIVSLFENKKVSREEIKNRKKAFAFYVDKELNRILYTGDTALKIWESFAPDTKAERGTLKGVVVHGAGRKVKGVVKIISRDFSNPKALRKSMQQMQTGDILVAATTDLDFMEGIKKAGAIVTDVGGMLSHAAISARELDIPCIIGTEIASKILKDGDLVEVDAEKGVVRILERTTPMNTNIAVENVIAELKKYPIEKHTAFNAIPVVYYEASAKSSYVNPPIPFENGNSVVLAYLINNKFESWIDLSRITLISDEEKVRLVIEENKNLIRKYLSIFNTYLKKDLSNYSHKKLTASLKELNTYLAEIYKWFGYFVDERLEVKDKTLLSALPDIRLKVGDGLITVLWECYDKLLDTIANNTKIERTRLNKATSNEIYNLLNEKNKRDQFVVTADRPIVHLLMNNKLLVFTDGEAMRIYQYLQDIDPRKKLISKAIENNSIKGASAQKGRANGTVVILSEKNYLQFRKVLRGKVNFVLVTPMTRPEIVPYMKKSNAIVTDEGGITSHAAIVSRELKKPCIIGTKIATQVLKDGDLVEVDADKGVVKILERSAHKT